ncbi:MAG: hypothetical protein ACM3S1_14900 [Hyphomicrobiales bacterium]
MTSGPGDLREAVERNARAVMEGNFSQLMADITPEAMAQMMQMAPQGGAGMNLAQLPNITGYEIQDMGTEGDGHVYQVTFTSEMGRATLSATWKDVLGQWKITSVGVVSIEPAEGTG